MPWRVLPKICFIMKWDYQADAIYWWMKHTTNINYAGNRSNHLEICNRMHYQLHYRYGRHISTGCARTQQDLIHTYFILGLLFGVFDGGRQITKRYDNRARKSELYIYTAYWIWEARLLLKRSIFLNDTSSVTNIYPDLVGVSEWILFLALTDIEDSILYQLLNMLEMDAICFWRHFRLQFKSRQVYDMKTIKGIDKIDLSNVLSFLVHITDIHVTYRGDIG